MVKIIHRYGMSCHQPPKMNTKNPAPSAQEVKVKLNIVILRLDRGIHFFYLDCPIKPAFDRRSSNDIDEETILLYETAG